MAVAETGGLDPVLAFGLVGALGVGSQWLVSGVCLHTSRIRARCQALCRSPESCQRKYFRFFMSTTIARTHLESFKASSLRAIAILVFLNLYLPFKA